MSHHISARFPASALIVPDIVLSVQMWAAPAFVASVLPLNATQTSKLCRKFCGHTNAHYMSHSCMRTCDLALLSWSPNTVLNTLDWSCSAVCVSSRQVAVLPSVVLNHNIQYRLRLDVSSSRRWCSSAGTEKQAMVTESYWFAQTGDPVCRRS